MFQCLGLGTVEAGGCGEDWYHPECLMGLGRDWYKAREQNEEQKHHPPQEGEVEAAHPVPPGFPEEDEFESMICYKCVESNPWIKQYAGTPGFLKPVLKQAARSNGDDNGGKENSLSTNPVTSLKRKASDSALDAAPSSPSKRVKDEEDPPTTSETNTTTAHTTSAPPPEAVPSHKHEALPPAPTGTFSLFLQPDFAQHICHCPACYPNLIPHPQLIEPEEVYEPSISSGSGSESGAVPGSGTRSHGTASLLDRGEAALSAMDRVKALEGVMVYNHLRDKVKAFLKPYAESGQAVSAEDIKAYFEKLRGDEAAIKEASAKSMDGAGDGDNRREQSGY